MRTPGFASAAARLPQTAEDDRHGHVRLLRMPAGDTCCGRLPLPAAADACYGSGVPPVALRISAVTKLASWEAR